MSFRERNVPWTSGPTRSVELSFSSKVVSWLPGRRRKPSRSWPPRRSAILPPTTGRASACPRRGERRVGSVDNEQTGARPRGRAVRLVRVGNLVAHPRPQHEAPPVLELRLELPLQHEEHVALPAPVVGQVPRRVLDHSDPDSADLTDAPRGRARLT